MNVGIAMGMFGIFLGGYLVASSKYIHEFLDSVVYWVGGVAFLVMGIRYVIIYLPN